MFIKAKWKCNWLFIAGLLRALSFNVYKEVIYSIYLKIYCAVYLQKYPECNRLSPSPLRPHWSKPLLSFTYLTVTGLRRLPCFPCLLRWQCSLNTVAILSTFVQNPPTASDFTKCQNPHYSSHQTSAGGICFGSHSYLRSFVSRYPQC